MPGSAIRDQRTVELRTLDFAVAVIACRWTTIGETRAGNGRAGLRESSIAAEWRAPLTLASGLHVKPEYPDTSPSPPIEGIDPRGAPL